MAAGPSFFFTANCYVGFIERKGWRVRSKHSAQPGFSHRGAPFACTYDYFYERIQLSVDARNHWRARQSICSNELADQIARERAVAENTADIIMDRLIDWGVKEIFGIPGDGMNGLMEALRKRRDKIRFVHVRHEEAAAFMACAYAKYTGKLGVCLATSGPGGIHLLNGLYDAKLDQAPVLAITGMTYHDLVGTMYQQDVNTDYLFQDVAGFNQRVMGPAHVVNLTNLAIRTALTRRCVAHITFPTDLQEKEVTRKNTS